MWVSHELVTRLSDALCEQVTDGTRITGCKMEALQRYDLDLAQFGRSEFTTDNDPDMRDPTDSPMTVIPERPMKPDITIPCRQCNIQLDLGSLNTHRYYHRALEVMRYKGKSRPESVEKLMVRRRVLLKRLKAQTDSLNPLDPKGVQRINDAYEMLKSDVEETYSAYREVRETRSYQVAARGLNSSTECVLAVGMCTEQNDRWKSVNEDRCVFRDSFGGAPWRCFLAVFDGHNGTFAADMAATELHNALRLELQKEPNDDQRSSTRLTSGRESMESARSRESTVMLEQIIHSARGERPRKAKVNEQKVKDIEPEVKGSAQEVTNIEYSGKVLNSEKEEYAQEKIKNVKNARNLSDRKDRNSRQQTGTSSRMKRSRDDGIAHAFKRAHEYTDRLLEWGKDENSRVRWSGCSTLTCIIQDTDIRDGATGVNGLDDAEVDNGGRRVRSGADGVDGADGAEPRVTFGAEPPQELGVIHLANTGNVQCMLVRGNKPYMLSKDHTPNNPRERARVEKAGGRISDGMKDLRVNGILATTRGLGNHGDPALKRCVPSNPHTSAVPVDQYAQFLVMASHGVWEVFSQHEVAALMAQMLPPLGEKMLPDNYAKPPSATSSVERLLAYLSDDVRSRIQSAASLSVASARDLARRQNLLSAASSTRRQDGAGDSPTHAERQTSTPSGGEHRVPLKTSQTARVHHIMQGEPHHTTRIQSLEHNAQTLAENHAALPGSPAPPPLGGALDTTSITADIHSEAACDLSDLSDIDDDELDDDEGNHDVGKTYPEGATLGLGTPITRDEIQREFARAMAERLVQAALLAGAKDNITVNIVLFPGCGL